MQRLTRQEIDAICASDDIELQRLAHRYLTDPLYTFQPRPDCAEEHDQQTSFLESNAKFSVCLGGNGSGKTIAAAQKTARHVLFTPPPRERCPFWVIGETFELACGTCWTEKLSTLIPKDEIVHIAWNKRSRNWPAAVLLRHPVERRKVGWVLEFKSYAQGREVFQAASIGGYWFNEEVPMDIVHEVMFRCRDYDSPGWADFTPVRIRSPEWLDKYRKPPDGWKFFHLNTMCNTALAPGYAERMLGQLPDDVRRVRQFGFFAALHGMVFREWQHDVHVIDPFPIPADWHKIRSIDFGWNNAFCCLWLARDRDGAWHIYDEHFESGQLNEYHTAQINGREWDYGDPHYGQTYSDHDAQQRNEMGAAGIHCTPANKDVLAGVEHLRKLMKVDERGRTRLYVHSNCKNLIREIPSYRWPDTTGSESKGNQKNAKEVPVAFDDHAIDAMRYGIYTDDNGRTIGGGPKHLKIARQRYKSGVNPIWGH